MRTRRHALLVLSTGHAASDLVQGAVPAMLPFMVEQRGLSYGAAAGLLLAASAASSIVQPLFGLVSDRAPRGVDDALSARALGGIGIALAGWAGSYPATLLALLVAGLGVAAFHPEAARFAGYAAEGRAAGMSTFSVGGNIGFALGPILTVPLALAFGLRGMIGIAVVTALAALLLMRELPALEHLRPPAERRAGAQLGADRWGAFSLIAGAGALRTGVTFALQAFIPLFVIDRLGGSEAVGAAAVAVLLLAGAVGTLAGGRIADSFGHRRLVVWSLVVCVRCASSCRRRGRRPVPADGGHRAGDGRQLRDDHRARPGVPAVPRRRRLGHHDRPVGRAGRSLRLAARRPRRQRQPGGGAARDDGARRRGGGARDRGASRRRPSRPA